MATSPDTQVAPAAHPSSTTPAHPATFDPALWLEALTEIGGGFALMADRRLAFMVDECGADDLAAVMAELVGRPDRLDAIKDAIERAQAGEA